MSVTERIEEIIKGNDVVLFMKGTRSMPQCGFSATVVGILNEMVPEYTTFNVLEDPEIRQGIKEFSDWPTIPQLYVKGEFMGGCDIVREMHGNGELYSALGVEPPKVVIPSITITDSAKVPLQEALGQAPDDAVLRLSVDDRFRHDLFFGNKGAFDGAAESNGITVYLDPTSAKRAEGVTIDFVEDGAHGAGFKIENPNGPTQVNQLTVEELKKKLDASEELRLLDVRTPEERDTAKIDAAAHLTPELVQELLQLPKDTQLVFLCHHGGRSQRAAEEFTAQGFKNVHNVQGGIDSWSLRIDDSVPRY